MVIMSADDSPLNSDICHNTAKKNEWNVYNRENV